MRAIQQHPVVRRFRLFRYTRPFWAGLLVLIAGLEIGYLPLGPVAVLIHAGKGAVEGLACSVLLIVMGLLLWFAPSQRKVAAVITVLVSLASFPLSNLGGFVIGMLLGILGGSMAFGWVPDKRPVKPAPLPEVPDALPDQALPPRRPSPIPASERAPVMDSAERT